MIITPPSLDQACSSMATKRRIAPLQCNHPFLRVETGVSSKKIRLPKQHSEEEDKIISSGISDDDFVGFPETEELVSEEEEKKLEDFMSNRDASPEITLKDVIDALHLSKLDNIVINLYKSVGKLLNRKITGEVPKALKYIPLLEHWENVLYLTEPEKWSADAMFHATEIFTSNVDSKKAERFYSLVLLPRIREDIRKNKRLHVTLYRALMKSVSCPTAFNRGILFPLCMTGTCTLREAVIVGSVIQKASIPPLQSSVAIFKLAQMDYCGTTSYFIKLLLDKKHALPYGVLDVAVAHFVRFLEVTSVMPVIWHQSPLTFVQRFKNELTKQDKEKLENLLRCQNPNLVTVVDEILGELKGSRNCGENITSTAVAEVSKAAE